MILALLVIVLAADINPRVKILPPVIDPVALIKPDVDKFPPVILPFASTVPKILIPDGENTAIFPTVLTDMVTLALAVAIFKLLLPFTTLDTEVIIPVSCDPLPKK